MTAFRAGKSTVSDAKSCPNRAQKEGPTGGPDVTVGTTGLAQSHRWELNPRPLQSIKYRFERFSRRIKGIIASFSLFRRPKSEKSTLQTVPKACLETTRFAHPDTNLLRRIRVSPVSEHELVAAIQADLKAAKDEFAFRRWN